MDYVTRFGDVRHLCPGSERVEVPEKKSEGLRSHDSDLRNGHVVVFSAMFHM